MRNEVHNKKQGGYGVLFAAIKSAALPFRSEDEGKSRAGRSAPVGCLFHRERQARRRAGVGSSAAWFPRRGNCRSVSRSREGCRVQTMYPVG